MFNEDKQRIIQEYVPGKQITLAHVIPSPVEELYEKMGLIDGEGAVGIITITPSEAAIIVADTAVKAADVELGFVDRFSGSVIVTGTVSEVEASIEAILQYVKATLGYAVVPITRT